MKIRASSVTFLVVLSVLVLIFGCEEQELNSRRIRLVGDENLKLKEQLKICNQQIRKLEDVIDEYENQEQKRTDTDKETGEMVIKLLRDNESFRNEIEKLTEENQQLKAKLADVESALAEVGGQPSSQ